MARKPKKPAKAKDPSKGKAKGLEKQAERLRYIEAKRALAKHRHDLLKKGGVQAIYIGFKEVNGKKTKDYAVVCGVKTKLDKRDIKSRDMVPDHVNGVPTDVVQTGEFKALATTDKHRPAPGGVSIGHFRITAGTLGCLVTDNTTGEVFILSNNHVLADSNNGTINDAIYQPGPHDGGRASDTIANLYAFIPIEFATDLGDCPIGGAVAAILNLGAKMLGRKTRLQTVKPQIGVNYIDCALAKPIEAADVIPDILGIGIPTGSAQGNLGDAVKKSGRTTGLTTDVIVGTDAIISVQYAPGQIAIFEDQFVMGPMSAGGDSGSAILNNDNKVVALLFAGSDTTTIASPIHYALDAFDVRI